jgi:hypothetical protein
LKLIKNVVVYLLFLISGVENKILIVADVEIADELKVTEESKQFYKINYEKDVM